jgi:malate dehydrogenase (oxaloacetate-decarboxylating)(NADP+)
MGMRKPVHALQHGCEVNDVVNLTAVAVVDAQEVASAAMADLLSAVQTRFGPAPVK